MKGIQNTGPKLDRPLSSYKFLSIIYTDKM